MYSLLKPCRSTIVYKYKLICVNNEDVTFTDFDAAQNVDIVSEDTCRNAGLYFKSIVH